MVIIFSNRQAREQLLTTGTVYTFRRGKLRKKLRPDWAAARRRGPKIAEVIVTPIMHVEAHRLDGALRTLVDYSGFDTVKDWLEHIYRKSKKRPEGWIYRVDTVNRKSLSNGTVSIISTPKYVKLILPPSGKV